MSNRIRVGRIIYKSGKKIIPKYKDYTIIEVMTPSTKYGALSPYLLKDSNENIIENVWQFSKVYKSVDKSIQRYSKYDPTIIWNWPAQVHIDQNGFLTDDYYAWRRAGIKNPYAVRYPVGLSGRHECLYALSNDNEKQLNYIEARKEIYYPLYVESVRNHQLYKKLLAHLSKDTNKNILIVEVDGPHQESLQYYIDKYHVQRDFIVDGTIEVTKENIDIMLNDSRHAFGHGYCLGLALAEDLSDLSDRSDRSSELTN